MCPPSGYYYGTDHVTKDCLELLKKWEEKKEHYNIMKLESCMNKNKDEEVDVWVINQ
jgi:hypothetical protein